MFSLTRTINGTPRAELNRLFTDVFGVLDGQSHDGIVGAWMPAVDVFEENDGIRILAEVPGVKPEDVKISIENNILTVRGSKDQVAEEKTKRVHRYERTYGAFERTFVLPATVDAGRITAAYEHGVLSVFLPKMELAKPREIQVEVAKA